MKKGDVVVVPSENAEYLIIGEIESDKTLFLEKGSSSSIQDNDIVPSNYCIRKQIKWLKRYRRQIWICVSIKRYLAITQ